MEPITPQNQNQFSVKIAYLLQWLLNISLFILAIILTFFLFRETYRIALLMIASSADISYQLVEKIVVYFLYFEFLALIIKYFKAEYHFPLRYFIYIGITATVRFIIVDHSHPMNTILFSGAILLMVLSLFIANSPRLRRNYASK